MTDHDPRSLLTESDAELQRLHDALYQPPGPQDFKECLLVLALGFVALVGVLLVLNTIP